MSKHKLSDKTLSYINLYNEDIKIHGDFIKETVLEVKIGYKAFNRLVRQFYNAFETYIIFNTLEAKSDIELIEDIKGYYEELKRLYSSFKTTKKVITEKAPAFRIINDIYKINGLIIAVRYLMAYRLFNKGKIPFKPLSPKEF